MTDSITQRGHTAEGANPHTVALTVGTAGHIDHGKTELVKFFTGCETDRLPEEKARGMTIDLGFATCNLPNNRRVGIVDVPGHEKFIHNMVAGASAIDVVLLVVAADDGVMPQTIEHFHIVRMLGVTSGMVAITKIDLVAPERIAEVEEEVEALVAGSFLDGCPIVPVSSKTGEGFDAFYETFVATVDKTAEHDTSGAFRLHVERSFILKGLGTIVSGIPRSGTVKLGDTVEILPGGEQKRVRGIQVYGVDADQGRAGECVALRLADVSRRELGRGMVVATPGCFSPSRFVSAKFHLLPELDKPLNPRTAVRLHVGTADIPGHLVLPELQRLPPGGEAYVQFQLREPIVGAAGDFLVVRQLSPVRTIGGGYVVRSDDSKMRRSRGDWAESAQAFEEAFREPAGALQYVMEKQGLVPLGIQELVRHTALSEEAVRRHVAEMSEDGRVVVLAGERYVAVEALAQARDEILAALNQLHDGTPLALGFPKRQLFPMLVAPRVVVDRAMDELLTDEAIARNAVGYQIPERAPRLSPSKQAVADKLAAIYRDGRFATPRRDELPELLGAPAPVVDPILDYLVQTGELIVVSPKVILHRQVVEESKERILDHFRAHDSLESGAFRNMLNTSRKYVIPLLEYWDAQGLTKRVGDVRKLREEVIR